MTQPQFELGESFGEKLVARLSAESKRLGRKLTTPEIVACANLVFGEHVTGMADDSAPTTPRAKRQPNPVFEALAIAEGSDPRTLTKTAARTISVALASIRRACPDVTPAEIQARAARYRAIMPSATRLTASALEKHWAKCGSERVQFESPSSVVSNHSTGPEGWRDHLRTLYPENTYEGPFHNLPESIRAEILRAG